MDTTIVLGAILREGLENVGAFAIYDPEAVQQAIAAGIGAQITLSIGGKIRMPAIPGDSPPLTVTGTPAGRNSQPYQSRRVCAGNTNCIPICPIQAKYDPSVTLEQALKLKSDFDGADEARRVLSAVKS